jgi:FkbM family methyltransferase
MNYRMNILKEMGYYPDTILDIGAHHGKWTDDMKQIFSDAAFFLFEGIDYPELKRFQSVDRVNVYNVILNDKIDKINWYQKKNTGDSIFREKTHHYKDCEVIQRDTIDLNTHIATNNLFKDSNHILIKIDCQGAEIPILKGANTIFDKTDFILIEIPLFGQYNEGVPTFLEHILYMNSIGFAPYDILENHYINNFNMQVDVLFVNKRHKFNDIVNEMLL